MPHKRKNAKNPVIVHGLYADLAKRKIDGRTKLAKVMREARTGLAQLFPGGRTNAAAALIIDRIIYKTLRLSLYEGYMVKGLGEITSEQQYLNIANSLRADLQLLTSLAQRQAPAKEVPDLREYLEKLQDAGNIIQIKGESQE